MEINEFIQKFADQFEDTDASVFNAQTKFRDLEEWSSLTGMCLIAMVKTSYGKTVTGSELRSCQTIEDVFNVVNKAN